MSLLSDSKVKRAVLGRALKRLRLCGFVFHSCDGSEDLISAMRHKCKSRFSTSKYLKVSIKQA